MRKLIYIMASIAIVSIGTVAGLHFTGYFFNTQQIIPPISPVVWDDNIKESNTKSNQYPILLNLTNTMQTIPGIQNIRYEVFVSNDSIQKNIQYYTDILENNRYTYSDDYSGLTLYENTEIYYRTFTKGLNAVVIYLSDYNHLTWICYSTSDIIHYQQIYDYMITHNIIS